MGTNWRQEDLGAQRNTFLLWGWLARVTQGGCGVLGNVQKPSGIRSGQSALSDPASAGRWDKIIPRGPFQPQPLCDCRAACCLDQHKTVPDLLPQRTPCHPSTTKTLTDMSNALQYKVSLWIEALQGWQFLWAERGTVFPLCYCCLRSSKLNS